MWIAHASLKWMVFTLVGTAQFLQPVGISGCLAYPAFIWEIVGGLALILSIHALQVSPGLTPVLMAAASVPFGNGWVQTDPNDGWKYPIFLVVAAATLYLMGDGASAIRQGDCFALRL